MSKLKRLILASNREILIVTNKAQTEFFDIELAMKAFGLINKNLARMIRVLKEKEGVEKITPAEKISPCGLEK